MRAMVYAGPGDLRPTELADPTLGPRDILVRIEACGICGSDVSMRGVHGHYAVPGRSAPDTRCRASSSSSGRPSPACTPGSASPSSRLGRAVDARTATTAAPHMPTVSRERSIGYSAPGGFAGVVIVQDVTIDHDIVPVPPDVETDDLVWVEPLSVAVHAVRRAGLDHSSGPSLVLGAGSVGLCVLAAAKAAGASGLVVVEPRADRLAAAASLG